MTAAMRLFAVLALCVATAVVHAQGWTPSRHVELIAPNAPGGAMDSTARIVQRRWQEMRLLPVSSAVVNRSGGEHALALAHILCRRCRHRHTDNHHTRDADPGFHLVASLR